MDGEGRVSAARLLFRFGIGTTELAGERLIAALRELDSVMPDVAAEGAPERTLRLHHALLGAVTSLPAWARVTLARRRAARSMSRRGANGRRLASRLPGADRIRQRYEMLLARVEAQLVRWALAGRREELAGRALAETAIREASHELVSAVAESPELKRVIAEQSEGLGTSAMAELRESTARADALAERVTRRFLRRSR